MMQGDRTTGKLVKVNKMGEEMLASLVIDGARRVWPNQLPRGTPRQSLPLTAGYQIAGFKYLAGSIVC